MYVYIYIYIYIYMYTHVYKTGVPQARSGKGLITIK